MRWMLTHAAAGLLGCGAMIATAECVVIPMHRASAETELRSQAARHRAELVEYKLEVEAVRDAYRRALVATDRPPAPVAIPPQSLPMAPQHREGGQ